MDILKYFYEEPVALELLSPEDDPDPRRRQVPSRSLEALLQGPRYYRGYLAGTDLATGRIGLTALAHPEAFIDPFLAWLNAPHWQQVDLQERVTTPGVDQVRHLLGRPSETALLVNADAGVDPALLRAATGDERRYTLAGLRRVLDAVGVALIPEPAHSGFDWSLFSAQPMREAFIEALRAHPVRGVRRFVLPYQQARSESKFYFELWQLNQGPLPPHIQEV